MDKKILFITKAAVIAALYAVLTYIGGIFNLSYGSIQFRFSEALCILPLFTSSAIPGLAVGCFVANIVSTVNPLDTVLGSLATLLACITLRALDKVKIKSYPFCSMLMPVIFNGVIVGAEIAFFTTGESFLTAFAANAVSVALGEAAVMFTLGTLLYYTVLKNNRLRKAIADK